MSEDKNENHYIGTFTILQEKLNGELIYNKKKGIILLNVAKRLDEKLFIGKSYANIPVITGTINTGVIVTLFNNKCVNNFSQVGQSQSICFRSDYLVWSRKAQINTKYNELVCNLKNAFAWSQMSIFEKDGNAIKVKEDFDEREFDWFGVKVKFSVFSNQNFLLPFDAEENTIVQRVKLSIVSKEKLTIDEFVLIKDKVLSMISFAIKNNVNVDKEYFLDYDDSYLIGGKEKFYHIHYLLSAHRELEIYHSQIWNYNFTLNQIPTDKDINKELEKLVPIFNLYLSLFKYRDMPIEMVFLNIVQALETFHSRFFYDNKKSKYVESVMERFSESAIFEEIKDKLLSDTQMDENCNYIILVSRLNDLLIGNYNMLFYEYWKLEDDYAQLIAYTRHYYTHYGSSKEKKALKGDGLNDAIFVLSRLLEYHICFVLGIDITKKIGEELKNHLLWKQLEEHQNSDKVMDTQ